MKKYLNLLFIIPVLIILLASCEKAAEDPNQGCLFFFNRFEDKRDLTEIARNNYSTNPNTENCKALEEALAQYLLAIAALTTVDYCLELRDDIDGMSFGDYIINETFTTQQALEEIDGKCE